MPAVEARDTIFRTPRGRYRQAPEAQSPGPVMDVYEKGFYTILGCALLFAAIAAPLALRRVPRNVVYGYRTRTTLSDDTIWYEANAYFGRGLVIASLAAALLAWALELTRPFEPETYLPVSIGILVVPSLVAAIATARFVRTLTRNPRGPGSGR